MFVIQAEEYYYIRFDNTLAGPLWSENPAKAKQFETEELATQEASRYLPGYKIMIVEAFKAPLEKAPKMDEIVNFVHHAKVNMKDGDRITLVGPFGNKIVVSVLHDEITVDVGHIRIATVSQKDKNENLSRSK